MIITKLEGITFNRYGNTEQRLPLGWVEIEFNFRLKNHRAARDSKRTRIIKKLTGWGGSKKYPVPLFSYWTNDPEWVEQVKLYGDVSNAEHFILCSK